MHTFKSKDGFLYVDEQLCFVGRGGRYDAFFDGITTAELYAYHNVDNRLSPTGADAEFNHVSFIRIMPEEYVSLKELIKPSCCPEKVSGPTIIIHCREYAGQLVHELFFVEPRTAKELATADEDDEEN